MIITRFLIFLLISTVVNSTFNLPKSDINLLEFSLNLEFLEAEYFLFGSMGKGLDTIEPDLADGGPPPIGAQRANLSLLIKDIITQFGYQEIGHISADSFATIMNDAFEIPLSPPFDPYANASIILFHATSSLTSASPVTSEQIQNSVALFQESRYKKKVNNSSISYWFDQLVAGLLGVEAGQDAVIRSLLYERANEKVVPYETTVVESTQKISQLRDKLGNSGLKDEGLKVPIELGAEKKIQGNVLAGDEDSLAYGRTPKEIPRIVYGTGDEHAPGGFYPNGANGVIAKRYYKR
ncbi:hypothetical protein L1987_78825 [Smallanthus sonchifolius]|uniref:Uncharacterized protein n=1 Tax=Smallanthus sonchifolius TaxID=185202 RepID=A0ACB8ZET2_9ASTR|nr:hypothetical protein L1987_78825 [Smallanthus sonchifolius]